MGVPGSTNAIHFPTDDKETTTHQQKYCSKRIAVHCVNVLTYGHHDLVLLLSLRNIFTFTYVMCFQTVLFVTRSDK